MSKDTKKNTIMSALLQKLRIKYFLMLFPFILMGSALFLVLQTSGVKINTSFLLKALNQFENVYLDLKMRLKPVALPNSPMVIVGFDERTLEAIGQWPPHRSQVADLLEFILKDDPKVIGLDIIFSEEERQFFALTTLEKGLSKSKFDSDQQNKIREFIRSQAPTLSGDLSLGTVVEKYSDKIVLGYHWYGRNILSDMNHAKMIEKKEVMAFSQFDKVSGLNYDMFKFPLWNTYYQLNQNITRLTDVAEHYGAFNAVSDGDGIYRRTLFFSAFKNEDKSLTFFPSLALQMARVAQEEPIELSVVNLGNGIFGADELKLGDTTHKLQRDGTRFLNFYGPGRTFPHISAKELVLGSDNVHITQIDPNTEKPKVTEIPAKNYFKDKVVLVGATASGVFDLRPTPKDRLYVGVELHATAFANMASNVFLQRRSDWGLKLTGLWLIIFMIFSLVLLHLSALKGALFSAACIGLLTWVDYKFLFLRHHLMLVMAVPLTTMGGLYGFSTFVLYFFEGREKKFIRSAFGKYVSASVVDEVVSNKQALTLGGTKKEVSILFSDIRGFTTISEKMESVKLSQLLSDYLTPMTDIVIKHKGTLDKYIGDALMAFWNAPLDDPNHGNHALETALDMLSTLHDLNKQWVESGQYPPISIGIGLNTGTVSVGNMGSQSIFDYTVIGDAVNLGSRVEGLTKNYGAQLLISESTANVCDLDHLFIRRADKVAVKGKKLGVVIFQVFGRKDDPRLKEPKMIEKIIPIYESALETYKKKQWDQAITQFKEVLSIFPKDKASMALIDRILTYKANPEELPEDWDGTYIATSK
jgi:adenylate cyclase